MGMNYLCLRGRNSVAKTRVLSMSAVGVASFKLRHELVPIYILQQHQLFPSISL